MKVIQDMRAVLKNFRTKIFLLICMVIVLSLTVSMMILYDRSIYSIKNQAADVAHNSIDYEIQIADNLFSKLEFYSKKLTSDEALIEICSNEEVWDYSRTAKEYRSVLKIFKNILKTLDSSNMPTDHISYSLYLCDRQLIFDSKTTFYDQVIPENISFLNEYQKSEGCWTSGKPVDEISLRGESHIVDMEERIIMKGFEIKDASGKTIAVLSVNVSSGLFQNYYNEIQKGLSGDTIIIDSNGEVILSSDQELENIFTGSFQINPDNYWEEISLQGEKYMIMSGDLDSIDSRIYILISLNTMLKNIQWLRKAYVFLLIIMIAAGMMIAGCITRIFYEPIELLKQNMGMVSKGHLNVTIDQRREDDLQDIYDSFNDMTQRLDKLINEVADEKLLNEKAELMLLQAQLNPHFLYNTFDSIYSMAKINKMDMIADIVAALSRFFRVSLSNGNNIVPFKDAVDIARSYLIIQNIRFANKIRYSIEIEERLWDIKVPKLLLQPLVENAVYHGLECKRGQGDVNISASVQGEYIRIIVEDNGVGMKADKLKEIKDRLYSKEENSKYYAMRNLTRQLKLLYKDMEKFLIESEYGTGTRITIMLPLEVDLMEDEIREGDNV